MERLTRRNEAGEAVFADEGNGKIVSWNQYAKIKWAEIIERLAAYEDAEEQRLLVRVVRCKGCKYATIKKFGILCEIYSGYMHDDDYCHRGIAGRNRI